MYIRPNEQSISPLRPEAPTENAHELSVKRPHPLLKFMKHWSVTLITVIVIGGVIAGGIFYIATNWLVSAGTGSSEANTDGNKTYNEKPVYFQSPTNGEFIAEDK